MNAYEYILSALMVMMYLGAIFLVLKYLAKFCDSCCRDWHFLDQHFERGFTLKDFFTTKCCCNATGAKFLL